MPRPSRETSTVVASAAIEMIDLAADVLKVDDDGVHQGETARVQPFLIVGVLVVVKHVVEHAVALGAEDVVPVRHDKVELGRIEMVDVFPNPAERAGLVVIAQNGQELSLAGKVHTLAQRVHVAVQKVGVERNVLSIHLQTDRSPSRTGRFIKRRA